jgi:hypothetical protein
MMTLMCATALALNGTPLWDEMDTVCEQKGTYVKCLEFSFQFSVPVHFEEDILCYSNESTGINGTIITCYSTISLTKIENFELVYVIANDSGKEYEHINKSYLPMNYTAYVSPNAIDATRCPVTFNEIIGLYEFKCPYYEKTVNADLAPGIEDIIMIVAFTEGTKITSELIVYIVLGAIIILLIYSVTKKKK